LYPGTKLAAEAAKRLQQLRLERCRLLEILEMLRGML
jgi:hypothetical protein